MRLCPFVALALSLVTAFAQTPAKDRMVILISLDGFPAFALDDPNLPVPTLRTIAKNGALARRMTTVNPTVTWPNHTAMITGVQPARHGVLANGTITSTGAWPPVKVEPWIEKTSMVHVPTVYDAAHQAGLTTAQVDWVAIHKAPTITYEFPEVPSTSGAIEKEMIAAGLVTAANIEQFRKGNILWRDQMWTTAAQYIIRKHKPNLLMFHLLSLDSSHHTYGPRTLGGQAAMAFLDSCVAKIIDSVRAAGYADKATLIVVSDHGFRPYTKFIQPAVTLAEAGLGEKVYALPEGGTALVYFEDPALEPKVRQLFENAEGVGQIVTASEFAAIGLPDPAKDKQMAKLVLAAKPGYSFSGGTKGTPINAARSQGGSHGFLASDPEMDAIFLAAGYGIRQGVTVERVRNLDVAATIAELLGVKLESIEGRSLTGILR